MEDLKPEKVQDSVPTAGRMTDLHYRSIGKSSCYRDGLFDEAEESLLHKGSSSASTQSFWQLIPTPLVDSIEPLRVIATGAEQWCIGTRSMQDTVVSTWEFLLRGTPYPDYEEFVVMRGDARRNRSDDLGK